MKKFIATAALMMGAASAGATEYPYIGLDYLQLDLTSGGIPEGASPEAARLRFGAVMAKYLALEAHVVGGTAGDSVVRPGVTYDVEVSGVYSLNGAVRLPLGDAGSIYAYAGYGTVRMSAESNSPFLFSDVEVDDDGLTYGVTVEVRAWRDWGLEVDYTTYLDNDTNELTALGVGIRRKL